MHLAFAPTQRSDVICVVSYVHTLLIAQVDCCCLLITVASRFDYLAIWQLLHVRGVHLLLHDRLKMSNIYLAHSDHVGCYHSHTGLELCPITFMGSADCTWVYRMFVLCADHIMCHYRLAALAASRGIAVGGDGASPTGDGSAFELLTLAITACSTYLLITYCIYTIDAVASGPGGTDCHLSFCDPIYESARIPLHLFVICVVTATDPYFNSSNVIECTHVCTKTATPSLCGVCVCVLCGTILVVIVMC